MKDITRATKLPLAKKTSASTLSEDELLQFTELEAKFELKGEILSSENVQYREVEGKMKKLVDKQI